MHEALPGEDVGPDQMDDVLSALDDEEIEVVDDASNIEIAPHRGSEEDAPPKTKAKGGGDGEDDGPAPAPTSSSTPRAYRQRRRVLQEQRPSPHVPAEDGGNLLAR